MTKEMLIKLLETLKKYNLTGEEKILIGLNNEEGYKKLLDLSDKELDSLVVNDLRTMFIMKTYLYINKNRLSEEIKNILTENIKKGNYKTYEAIKLIEEFKKNNRNNALEYVKLIVSAKSDLHAKYARETAVKNDYLDDKENLEYVKIVANAIGAYQSQQASLAAQDKIVVQKGGFEVVEVISNAKGMYQAIEARNATKLWNIISHKDCVERINRIAQANGNIQAIIVKKFADSPKYIFAEQLPEIMDIISKIDTSLPNTDKIPVYASRVATQLLGKENNIEFTQLVANAKNNYQARCAKNAVLNKDIMNNDKCYQIVEAIANSKGIHQSIYAYQLATNKSLLEREDASELIELVGKAETEFESKILKDKILTLSTHEKLGYVLLNNKLTNETTITKLVETGEYDYVIKHLNDYEISEVNSYTKFKIKK